MLGNLKQVFFNFSFIKYVIDLHQRSLLSIGKLKKQSPFHECTLYVQRCAKSFLCNTLFNATLWIQYYNHQITD